MPVYDPSRVHLLVPCLFTEQNWTGGAVYQSNLLAALSALPEGERPHVLLLDTGNNLDAGHIRKALEFPAVIGAMTLDNRVHLNPFAAAHFHDPATGVPDQGRLRTLLASITATFPLPYTVWKKGALPNPIYWIPDFQHKRLPHLFSAEELQQRDTVFAEIAASGVDLLLSSQAALDDYRHFYPDNRTRNHVWSFSSTLSADEAETPSPDSPAGRLPEHFFYLPNQFWAHKDHGTAFRALAILRDQGYPVHMVCTGLWGDYRNPNYGPSLQALIADAKLEDRVHYLGVLPRGQQISLFRRAAAIVQPSLFEGWSTVVEDTRALGRPIVLSDIAVNQEQMGADGLFFRAGDPEDLARVLRENWGCFVPGPDVDSERHAAARSQERRLASARRFMEVVATVSGQKNTPPQPQPAPQAPAAFHPGQIKRPDYPPRTARQAAFCYPKPAGTEWYPPVMAGMDHVRSHLFAGGYVEKALSLLEQLDGDDYTRYLAGLYREGLKRFGAGWRYADIVTVLLCLSDLMQPRRYLEIGVRRGRSLCAVASRTPGCSIAAFDMWISNYAGMDNPGPDFVRGQLAKVGFHGDAGFIDGNSHETVPRFLRDNPDADFDLITVDGDHSPLGAAADLCTVLPRLAVGGAIVFDDVCHPQHQELRTVWQELVANDTRFSSWTYDDVGYGIGVAIRKY